jgi:putative acetyltransferase
VKARLREGTPEDHGALAELWRAAWQVTCPDIDFAARLPFIHGQFGEASTGRYRLRVADLDALCVGFTLVDPAERHLEQIVIAPERWGEGIAGALLDDAITICRGTLALVVNRENPRALRFYARHGFGIIGEGINPASGRATYTMRLSPGSTPPN